MTPSSIVSEAVKELIAQSLQGFAERHPDGPIKKISLADIDVREVLQSLLKPRANLLADLERRVRDGELPLGVLSGAARKPLTLAILQHSVGHIHAGTDEPDTYDTELDAARDALGKSIVADVSALYLSYLSGYSLDVRRKFSSIATTRSSARDIEDAYRDAIGVLKSGISLGYDDESDSLRAEKMSSKEYSRLTERAAGLASYVENFEKVQVERYDLLSELKSEQYRVWIDPIEYASQTGTALYSDDVPVRNIARELGIPSFGTLALLDVLIESESIEDVTVEIIDLFMQEFVVDLPCTIDDVTRVAAAEGFQPGAASYALSRRSMWDDAEAAQECFELLRYVHESNPQADSAWLTSALLGVSAARPNSNVVGLMASFWLTRISDFDHASYSFTLSVAQYVARVRGLEDPEPDLNHGVRLAVENSASPNWIQDTSERRGFLRDLGVGDS